MRTIDMRDDPGSLQDNVVPALARRPDESTRESPIVLGDARVIAPRDRKAVSVRAWHEHRKGQFWVAPLIVIHVVHVEEPAVTIPGWQVSSGLPTVVPYGAPRLARATGQWPAVHS